MIDITSFNKALKSKWVKKYLDNDNRAKWKLFFDSESHDFGGVVIFRGNLNKNYLEKFVHRSDVFRKEILKIYSGITFTENLVS